MRAFFRAVVVGLQAIVFWCLFFFCVLVGYVLRRRRGQAAARFVGIPGRAQQYVIEDGLWQLCPRQSSTIVPKLKALACAARARSKAAQLVLALEVAVGAAALRDPLRRPWEAAARSRPTEHNNRARERRAAYGAYGAYGVERANVERAGVERAPHAPRRARVRACALRYGFGKDRGPASMGLFALCLLISLEKGGLSGKDGVAFLYGRDVELATELESYLKLDFSKLGAAAAARGARAVLRAGDVLRRSRPVSVKFAASWLLHGQVRSEMKRRGR